MSNDTQTASQPWLAHWPANIPRTVQYRAGAKPMHEYLLDNAREVPDRPAYIFYGREVTWHEL
ncbi:hypothetical protein ACNSTU_15720, partial [Aquisalimonas sp. APHAB1-3]|uniref:hypothetical protein n=1 Tax=Aquisalimonas sp. APHAB1-3 TaxID=3402080 RepID=UPI003AAD01AB